MSILRPTLLQQTLRSYSCRSHACARTFTSSTCHRSEQRQERHAPPKSIPSSPSFFTTRAVYYDQYAQLEKALGSSSASLRRNQLLPLPDFAKASLPAIQPVWLDKTDMGVKFGTRMTMTRYRKVTKILNQLDEHRKIANAGGCGDLGARLDDILTIFESQRKEALLARGKKKPVFLDEYGRSYTLGKRKTSSARVWMIPVQTPPPSTPEEMLGVPESETPIYPVTTTTILVNNLPLNQFFSFPEDRERITRPLKVAGALGKYNVFAIVRGGGTTGQSGALAHGIAKGIVAHDPELTVLFRRAKLTQRDPRMVERKKTGLAKARKRYAWVKR